MDGQKLQLGCSGDLVKYQAPCTGALKEMVAGRFRDGRKYLDALWDLVNRLTCYGCL